MHTSIARTVFVVLGLGSVGFLTACAGLDLEPHIPVSGVTGNEGGAELTLYYDGRGRPHFQN